MKGKTIAVGVLCLILLFFSCSTRSQRVERDWNAAASPPSEQDFPRSSGEAYWVARQGLAPPRAGAPLSRRPLQPSADTAQATGLRAGEELWVIVRSPDLESGAAPSDEQPVYPALRAKPPGAKAEVPLPLTHTDVQAS